MMLDYLPFGVKAFLHPELMIDEINAKQSNYFIEIAAQYEVISKTDCLLLPKDSFCRNSIFVVPFFRQNKLLRTTDTVDF